MFIPHPLLARFAAPGPVDPLRTRLVQELRHEAPLLGCRFDPSGRYLFAGAQDNNVLRWDLTTGAKTVFTGHRSWVRAFAFQGGRVFSADYFGKVLVWTIEGDRPEPIQVIDAHQGFTRALAVNPDGELLASCGNDRCVRLWHTRDLTLARTLRGHETHVYNVAFHPEGLHLVSADLRGVLRQWNLETGEQVRTLDCSILHRYDPTFRADHGGIRALTFNAQGSLLACAGITNVSNAFAGVGNPAVALFDWRNGSRVEVLRPQAAFQGTMWGVVSHAAGFFAGVAGGNGGQLYFWRPHQSASFHMVPLPTNARDLDLDASGRYLAVPFFDGVARLYDIAPPVL